MLSHCGSQVRIGISMHWVTYSPSSSGMNSAALSLSRTHILRLRSFPIRSVTFRMFATYRESNPIVIAHPASA